MSNQTEDQKVSRSAWLEALRSGKYQQGRVYLRSDEGFCCMGVALDTIDPSAWKDADAGTFAKEKGAKAWNECKSEMADEVLAARLGLSWRLVMDLADMNDRQLKSFVEIAAHIENLP